MKTAHAAMVATARFVYDFIFGDDWSVPAVMVLGLVATAWLAARGIPAWWLVPVLVIATTGVSLLRSRSPARRHPAR